MLDLTDTPWSLSLWLCHYLLLVGAMVFLVSACLWLRFEQSLCGRNSIL